MMNWFNIRIYTVCELGTLSPGPEIPLGNLVGTDTEPLWRNKTSTQVIQNPYRPKKSLSEDEYMTQDD